MYKILGIHFHSQAITECAMIVLLYACAMDCRFDFSVVTATSAHQDMMWCDAHNRLDGSQNIYSLTAKIPHFRQCGTHRCFHFIPFRCGLPSSFHRFPFPVSHFTPPPPFLWPAPSLAPRFNRPRTPQLGMYRFLSTYTYIVSDKITSSTTCGRQQHAQLYERQSFVTNE